MSCYIDHAGRAAGLRPGMTSGDFRMFNRPFLPFRVRPVRENIIRRSPLQPAEILDALDDLEPLAVKAVRRPVKASPVLASAKRARAGLPEAS
jgi:hypothetical protein